MSEQVAATCRHCETALPADHKGPCPKCGQTGKNVKVKIKPAHITLTGHPVTLKLRRKEILKANPTIRRINNGATLGLFVLTLVGFITDPLLGVFGLVLTFVNYLYGPIAQDKVRETIERNSG